MGIDRDLTRVPNASDVATMLQQVQRDFEEKGISADMDIDMAVAGGAAGGMRPVVKNIRLRTGERPPRDSDIASQTAIDSVAHADAGNISEVAASQLKISNNYYQSVLAQAQQSFRSAIVAASVGLGFFLAALGFGLAMDKLDIAIISSISGAIVEVIAGLNFWLFGRTATQLDLFHVRLEQTQRFLLANSVCENLGSDARDAARSELVRSISVQPKAGA
jgi:hypothetical protein